MLRAMDPKGFSLPLYMLDSIEQTERFKVAYNDNGTTPSTHQGKNT